MGVGTAGFTFPFNKGLGYQKFSSLSGNITLGTTAPSNVGNGGTTKVPDGATYAVIAAEGQAIRWLDADTIAIVGNPSSTDGMPVAAGSTVALQTNLVGLQIAPQVNGGNVHVWYGK